jgi:phage terminase large subunit
MRVLFAREILDSIKESLWAELAELIPVLDYPGWDIQEKKIINKRTKSVFAFKGLRDIKQARSMKGYSRFDRLIVDEAEAVPMDSWIMAVPTIRKEGSEIWAIFNRYEDLDPVYEKFCLNPGPDTLYIECNWRDNPWFPEVLKKEKDQDMIDDYDLYLHVWENHPIAQLEKAVFDRILVDLAMKTIYPADGPQVIGVDVGRYGNDATIAYERRGALYKKIVHAKKEKPIVTAREIANKADSKSTMINIDGGGLGAGGMIDTLQEMGYRNVNEINYNGTPKNKKKYGNVITEMYFECKEKLINASIPSDAKLKQDLTGRLFGYDKKNRKVLEEKKEFKKRYKRSPDNGDALVAAAYDPGRRANLTTEEKQRARKEIQKRRAKNRRRFMS